MYYIIITYDNFNEYQMSVISFRVLSSDCCYFMWVCGSVCGCVTTFIDTVTACVSYCAVSRVVIVAMTLAVTYMNYDFVVSSNIKSPWTLSVILHVHTRHKVQPIVESILFCFLFFSIILHCFNSSL